MKGYLGTFLVLASGAAQAQEVDKAEIIKRCRNSMSEYGAHMVKFCVDQDLEAALALSGYPQSAHEIIARCRESMGEYGWHMVKFCADQDLEAERALEELERSD